MVDCFRMKLLKLHFVLRGCVSLVMNQSAFSVMLFHSIFASQTVNNNGLQAHGNLM